MEALKTVWDFIQNEVLGMSWLNRLISTILNACGLEKSAAAFSFSYTIRLKLWSCSEF